MPKPRQRPCAFSCDRPHHRLPLPPRLLPLQRSRSLQKTPYTPRTHHNYWTVLALHGWCVQRRFRLSGRPSHSPFASISVFSAVSNDDSPRSSNADTENSPSLPSENALDAQQTHSTSHPSYPLCYSRSLLLHLSKSPLVNPPVKMPAFTDWFGWVFATQ